MNFLALVLLDAAPAAEGGGIMGFLPIILMFVVIYFFMIRPQMKRQKELKAFRAALAVGDKVVTSGGIYGKISAIKESYVILQVDTNTKLKVDISTVLNDLSDSTPAK